MDVFFLKFQSQVHVPMPQANQTTNQQSLTPMQQQQAPTQPQQTSHPGYSGMFFDDVTAMGHHAAPKETVKPSVKDSQHNVVVGNTGGMQMPHPHPYAVPQHTQQTAPAQPTYKQPQAASSQSKFFFFVQTGCSNQSCAKV